MRSTSRNIICEKQPFGVGRRAVFLCAGMGSFAPPGASSFLSSLKESYQRKPLEATFQDFLARECAGVAPAGASWGVSCSGTSTLAVHNFRQPNQRFGASVVFFCKKKGTKENHLDLRSKDPLARYGSCKIGGADLAELVRWVTLLSVQGSLVPLAPLPLTAVRVGVGALVEWRLSNRAHCGAKHRNG